MLEAVLGGLCLLEVPKVMHGVLLCLLEMLEVVGAVEGGLCMLEVLEVPEVPKVVRCALLCMLEVWEVM